MNDQSIVDKTMRSVFVGNIPYEVSEEKLKDIFSEVGPVLSFKLVFDRDSGKPKGYGFCEYKDQETALCAMRNLNNYEIAGRNLRVDNACTEKSRLEMQSLMQSTQVESTYGESVNPDKAPEVISRAIASLPPEQMYEMMKQMKLCIQNNPTESRQLLLQNPQLSYALLQVMIVMKIIDTNTALTMLHPVNNIPAPLTISSTVTTAPVSNNISTTNSESHPVSTTDSKSSSFWNNVNNTKNASSGPQTHGSIQPPPLPPLVAGQDMDLRTQSINRFADQDLRSLQMPTAFPGVDMFKRDPRRLQQLSENVPPLPGFVPPPGMLPPLPLQMPMPPGGVLPVIPNMPRMVPPPAGLPHVGRPSQSTGSTTSSTTSGSNSTTTSPLFSAVGNDSEKANFIMKLLKLTDEELALLPAEHRQSILALKDQIAKSAGKR